MDNNITKIRLKYPNGEEPNLCIPTEYNEHHRFLLGRLGLKPLVAICMNLSAASKKYSDRTINRIISVSKKIGYDGWAVANLYPERATDARNLNEFDGSLLEENVKIVTEFLNKNQIKEVWGAWGNINHPALVEGKKQLLTSFKDNQVEMFTYAPLTKRGEPVHPLNRRTKQVFTDESKIYLEFL